MKQSNTVVLLRPVPCTDKTPGHGRVRPVLACITGAIMLTLATGCHASFGVILPQVQNEFSVGKTKAAWIGSMAVAMSAMWCPLIGRLCDKFSCRIIAMCGALLCAVGLFSTSLAPNLDVMFVTHGLLFGTGTSACIHTAYVEVARRFEQRRALATGLMSTGWSLGTLGISPLVHFLLNKIGWEQTFRILSGMFLLLVVLALTYRGNSEKGPGEFIERKRSCDTFLDFSLFKNWNFAIFILGISTFPFGYYTPGFFMMEHTSVLGLASSDASLLYCWMGLSNLFARLLSGKIIEHIDPICVVRTCLFSFGITALLFTLARTLPWILVYCILIGFIDGICSTASAISIVKCVGVLRYPQALGFYSFGQAISNGIAPPLASLVIQLTGHSHNAWYMLGAVTILGSLVLFTIKFRENTETKFPEKTSTEVLLIQKVSSV